MERRHPAVGNVSIKTEGNDEMTKTSISLQDLRRRLYVKAKTEPSSRFWGLYVHVCKIETLREAYRAAKQNDGAPGIDGVTFAAIETQGVESFLKQIQDELIQCTHVPLRSRRREIPKEGGKVRRLSIPAIRDRVVQGALKLIGWVNYFAIGNSSRCFRFIKDWVEKKIRRHGMKARKRQGYGWNRWNTSWLYAKLGYARRYCESSVGHQ